MTPLVDLGFLLLTFFILTTHLIDQRVMQLTPPAPGPPGKASNTLTILLSSKDRAFGYQGVFVPGSTELRTLGGKALRNTLEAFKQLSMEANMPPVCIVKTSTDVRYKQVVRTVDELNRAGIDRFSVQDSLLDGERSLLNTLTGP